MRTVGTKILTRQKRIVREAVQTMPNPFTAKDVCDSLATARPRVSRATIYRVLTLLREEGALREFWFPNGRRVCIRADDRIVQIVECADCGLLQCPPLSAAAQKLAAKNSLETILYQKMNCPRRGIGCGRRPEPGAAGDGESRLAIPPRRAKAAAIKP